MQLRSFLTSIIGALIAIGAFHALGVSTEASAYPVPPYHTVPADFGSFTPFTVDGSRDDDFRGKDVAVGPDGSVYVIENQQFHARLIRIDPITGKSHLVHNDLPGGARNLIVTESGRMWFISGRRFYVLYEGELRSSDEFVEGVVPSCLAVIGEILHVADRVNGKVWVCDFTSEMGNRRGEYSIPIGDPVAIAVDSKTSTLFIADGSTLKVWSVSGLIGDPEDTGLRWPYFPMARIGNARVGTQRELALGAPRIGRDTHELRGYNLMLAVHGNSLVMGSLEADHNGMRVLYRFDLSAKSNHVGVPVTSDFIDTAGKLKPKRRNYERTEPISIAFAQDGSLLILQGGTASRSGWTKHLETQLLILGANDSFGASLDAYAKAATEAATKYGVALRPEVKREKEKELFRVWRDLSFAFASSDGDDDVSTTWRTRRHKFIQHLIRSKVGKTEVPLDPAALIARAIDASEGPAERFKHLRGRIARNHLATQLDELRTKIEGSRSKVDRHFTIGERIKHRKAEKSALPDDPKDTGIIRPGWLTTPSELTDDPAPPPPQSDVPQLVPKVRIKVTEEIRLQLQSQPDPVKRERESDQQQPEDLASEQRQVKRPGANERSVRDSTG
jgi:hypothetical protein